MSSDGYYRHPTIHRERVVFVSEDDLWEVGLEGGAARRLTANPGMITFPAISPDGRTVAFTSRDEGHPEVYVMPLAGGSPRRVTWMGSFSHVVGWTPEGRVVVATDWRRPFRADLQLWAVPLDGGPPERLIAGPARSIAFEPGGPGRVIARGVADPARWKRYRGGTAGTLWLDRSGDGRFRQLIRLPGNLASPMWLEGRIYFLSDHEGVGNLYSTTPSGRSLQRHTHHEDFYARFPATDGVSIAYHAGADLWVYSPAEDVTRRIPVQTAGSRSQRNRRFTEVTTNLERFHLHPEGHSIALVSRGGLFTMPLWEGAPLRHGNASKYRLRLGAWMSDGKRLVAVTDEAGEESLVVVKGDATGRPRRIDGDFGRPLTLDPAPAGSSQVALTNQRQQLMLVDTSSGEVDVVHHSPWDRIGGHAWSPDGRWLAFAAFESHRISSLYLYSVGSGRAERITRQDFVDIAPAFDPQGRYLYFLSWRVFDPVNDELFFERGFPRGAKPYLVTLRADLPSPFAPVTRSPRAPGKPAGGEGEKETEAKGPQEVRIDLEGIVDRIVELPVPEARYREVRAGRGKVFFSSIPVQGTLGTRDGPPPPSGLLEAYDFSSEKVERVMDGITDFTLSADGKVLAIRAASKIRVVPVGFKEGDDPKKDEPGRESGYLDLGRIDVEVIPGLEWGQMFREAWRLQRDQFWTETMADVDWQEVYQRYLPLVDRVGSRAEFSDLLWELQGELGTSHAYELGGDYRPEPKWFLGFLGADLSWSDDSRSWVIDRIPGGDGWDEEASSPLSRPGVGVMSADLILAVDGVSTTKRRGPSQLLVHKAGKGVHLTVRTPGGRRRAVAVKTLKSELSLRYRDWVESNRAFVHRQTEGAVGYLHIPDMGPTGFAEFHRYFRAEVHRTGLVVDVRSNSGGNVSQLLLEKLARRRLGYDVSRWQRPESWPMDAPMGPMAAITDEYAGSDGDIFSHVFKLMGLGPLIGKRTWGGVIGIWARHALVDGTITTQPEFASWFRDVEWGLENYGTDPDIEVEIRPQDHAAGEDPQLERAVNEVMKLIRRTKPSIPEFGPARSLRPPRLGAG